jgi:hypothetical protein
MILLWISEVPAAIFADTRWRDHAIFTSGLPDKPGDFASIKRKDMPRCLRASGSVRPRTNNQSAFMPR